MPSGKNAWLTFLIFDLLIKIVILHALLAGSMANILLVTVGKHYSLDWTWILDWTELWTGLMDYGSILH